MSIEIARVVLGDNREHESESFAQTIPSAEPSRLFIELCEVVDAMPPSTAIPIPVEDNITRETHADVYWRERCRWLEFQQCYDYVVNEFEPPSAPRIPFNEVNKLRNAIEACLELADSSEEGTVESALRAHLPPNALRDVDLAPELWNRMMAPRQHPETPFSKRARRSWSNRKSKHQAPVNESLNKCRTPESRSCCILTGFAPQLRENVFCLIRVNHDQMHPDGLVEVDFPLQFIVVILTHDDKLATEFSDLGSTLGSFMSNPKFCRGIEAARTTKDVLAAVDTRICELMLVADKDNYAYSLVSDYQAENENDGGFTDQYHSKVSLFVVKSVELNERVKRSLESALWIFCPPFREFVYGLKCQMQRYRSDFTDAFTKENFSVMLSSIPFVYFVVFGPAITFGVLMETTVDPQFSVSNSIIASGFATTIFALFSAQPLAIVGPSGPSYIMEYIVAMDSQKHGIDYFSYRFWVLLYAAIFGIIFVIFNISTLVMYARRSIEQLFAGLISGFLIVLPLLSIFKAIPSSLPEAPANLSASEMVKIRKALAAGVDAFLAVAMTCFCLTLAELKARRLMRRRIRFLIGSFTVLLGVLFIIGLDKVVFQAYHVSHLRVPSVQDIDYTTWFNIPPFERLQEYGQTDFITVHQRAVLFGFIIAFLIFVEASLSGLVPLRGMAVKPGPAVIDNLVVNVGLLMISMFLGLPVISGVPVRTIAHVLSLTRMEKSTPPGVQPKPVCLVEQRVSIMIVGILVILSVYLGDILHYIPVAALFGLFLYLGLLGLRGLQYRRLVVAIFSRKKYWSQWSMLDGLPRKQVVFFTCLWTFELLALLGLFTMGTYKDVALAGTAIPFVVLASALLREFVLPRWRWIAPYLDTIDPYCVPPRKLHG